MHGHRAYTSADIGSEKRANFTNLMRQFRILFVEKCHFNISTFRLMRSWSALSDALLLFLSVTSPVRFQRVKHTCEVKSFCTVPKQKNEQNNKKKLRIATIVFFFFSLSLSGGPFLLEYFQFYSCSFWSLHFLTRFCAIIWFFPSFLRSVSVCGFKCTASSVGCYYCYW